MSQHQTSASRSPSQAPPAKPRPRGPVSTLAAAILGLIASIVTSLVLGTAVEIIGHYVLWPGKGIEHSQAMVTEDLSYIAQFPRSIVVSDTVQFAQDAVQWTSYPWRVLRLTEMAERARASQASSTTPNAVRRIVSPLLIELGTVLEILMYVAQDTAVRLAVALYALPAFLLACLFGLLDGLVRRDQRKFCGGRESGFLYHHSKHYAGWFLTAGFALYLAWPFGGFDPTWMVLVFSILVAATLSMTAATFKKYL